MNCRPLFKKRKQCGSIHCIFYSLILFLFFSACSSNNERSSIECAPYARKLTGVNLRGYAYSWWYQSFGKYIHTKRPQAGAILVFRRTHHLPLGHVSVVEKVENSRRILVDHANWQPRHINHAAPIFDVSSKNDWSLVKVWWPPTDKMGSRKYSTYGFILPR
ncbi:hypothetical protein COMNV_01604 [Commensalibacter sp. Nvir]|uniref:CHAP domain-containing protein n=1 Tax=Commensalibacter sp. Nvir TaxID=3069817 RepID=UPI002D71F953|nr:hypothetical protein COMNV_01604 [Commensalibacter sp. Nvir]